MFVFRKGIREYRIRKIRLKLFVSLSDFVVFWSLNDESSIQILSLLLIHVNREFSFVFSSNFVLFCYKWYRFKLGQMTLRSKAL